MALSGTKDHFATGMTSLVKYCYRLRNNYIRIL